MATSEQIRNKALKKLGKKSTGQTVSSELASDLDNAYTEVYAELEALNLTTWDSDEDIPDEFVRTVVALVAYARVDEYSIPNDRYQRIKLDALGDGFTTPSARQVIKELQASNVYQTPTAEYF